MGVGLYKVTVYKGDEAIDSANFDIGQFKEIGFWLDYRYYLDPAYRIVIEIF